MRGTSLDLTGSSSIAVHCSTFKDISDKREGRGLEVGGVSLLVLKYVLVRFYS